jgi:hypothetical protein
MAVPIELILDSAEFLGMVRAAADQQNRDRPLLYDTIVPDRPATEREIMAEYTTTVVAADIVADDSEALVYTPSREITMRTMTVPNLKLGRFLSQEMIEQADRLQQSRGTAADQAEFVDWKANAANDLALGLRQIRNLMKASMLRDSFSYDRYAIDLDVTWGMPASQKITSTIAWDQHATATPVTDILTAKVQTALNGSTLNTGIFTTASFQHMVQCQEFIDRIAGIVQYAVPANAYSPQDPQMEAFALQILGLRNIRFDDSTFLREEKDGTKTELRATPIPDVTLFNTADEGNAAVWDFANGFVTESRFRGMAASGTAASNPAAPQRGPYGYVTFPGQLNPPNITFWIVQRGFPRKKRKAASTVIDTGNYVT